LRLFQNLAVLLVQRVHGRGGRAAFQALEALLQHPPHGELVGAVPPGGPQAGVHLLRLQPAQLGVGHLPGPHALRAVVPAVLLHAAHRDADLAVGLHQDRAVEDAVLLGADQLLPVQQQHAPPGAVGHQQLRHAARAHLPHLNPPAAIASSNSK
jgi:hypothetical protein